MFFQLTENALISNEFYEQGDVFQLPRGFGKEHASGRFIVPTICEPTPFDYGQSMTIKLPVDSGRFFDTWQELLLANML